jgi:hypothetical protein
MNVAAVRPSCVAGPWQSRSAAPIYKSVDRARLARTILNRDPDDLIIEGVDKADGGVLYTPTRCAAASVR